jgi:chorismate synthase
MRGNTFGNFLTLTTFGESHGVALGAIIDGCPAGIPLTLEQIQTALDRRRPGQSAITTARGELDRAELLSGVFEGVTLGSPIAVMVRNHDARSEDYDPGYMRAGHADRMWQDKYGVRDWRGGGRASGRETLGRVIGGAVAEAILPPSVRIVGFTRSVGELDAVDIPEGLTRAMVDAHATRCPDAAVAARIEEELLACKRDGDSRGGVAELWIDGCPPGLGEPVFQKTKNRLADAMMSVGAVVGVTLGDAVADARMPGRVFHAGISGSGERAGVSAAASGIQGGITNAERIRLLVYFKPASTVGSMATSGRHDPCIIPRAIPVLEAMAGLVLADLYLASLLSRSPHEGREG